MTLFWMVVLVGCVPKGKLLDEQQQRSAVERKLDATQYEVLGLQQALLAEEKVNAELSSQTEAIDAKNKALQEQLQAIGDQLASLSTKSVQQTEQKAALEALLGKVQTDAAAATREAEEARARAAVLNEEKARLAADRARLAAEADKLRAEKTELEKQTQEYTQLVGQLEQEIASGEVTITELSGKLTVNMSNAILFDSGATKVKPAGIQALTKVAGVLATVTDREIRVEGHTDNVPVSGGGAYADNWALSALRATTVVGLLIDGGVSPTNIAAVGYGEHHPTVPNDTKEGRATNRRTEIVLAPRLK